MRPFDGTFERTLLPGSVALHLAPSEKFKTGVLKVFIRADLEPARASEIALLPSLLRRGTRSHPSQRALTRRLEGLAGAQLGADVLKFGEQQVISFKLEVAGDSFLPREMHAFEKGCRLLRELMLEPALDASGAFPANVVEQEKEKQRQFIDGLVNDKASYASERCSREMCRGEPFDVYEYGAREDLARSTPGSLAASWRRLFAEAPIDVFAMGALPPDAPEILSSIFALERGALPALRGTTRNPPPRPSREIRELMPVKQGKLCLGLRTKDRIEDPGYTALVMMNGVLGAFAHSKLFRNVREKAGLCYYASSALERTKGLLFIQSGIERENFEKARDLSLEQLDAIRRGDVTEEELDNTRRALRLAYRSLLDKPAPLANTVYTLELAERRAPLAELASALEAVSRDEIVAAAQGIWLDTVYFLEPDGTVHDEPEPAGALAAEEES
jgi:predicted Zn-dependent peptidase